MAIVYSYPLNKNITVFDELVGTTKVNFNGQQKTVTRNFMLNDLVDFFSVNGLQRTISLTTNLSSGPATLNTLTGVLNIPNYSSSVGTVTSITTVSPLTGGTITSSGNIGIQTASTSQSGALSSTDWTIFNGKQPGLNGNGFVKISGTTISYDNSTYLTSNQNTTLSGAVSGNGTTFITTTLANNIVGIANLSASGTPSSTTYLRGDNTWATVNTATPNLQQVTDIGATTDNPITINTNNVTSLTINSSSSEDDATAINIINAGLYGINIITVYTGIRTIADTAIRAIGSTTGIYSTGNDYGIIGESSEYVAIEGRSDLGTVGNFIAGSSANGIIIESGTSSTGIPFQVSKNSVTKASINQQGELTAQKLIKEGGTSSQFLMADGSTSTGGSGVTSVTATSPITSSGGATPVISTSMATNKLIGRSTTGTGVMEQITIGSGLTLSGGTLTNTATATPLGYYGAFQDMLTQTLATANVGQPFLIRTVDESNGVSITTNGSGQYTRITPANTGVYNIQWSGQFQNPDNTIHDVNVWFRKGLTSSSGPGTDVVGSNGLIAMPARKSAVAGDQGHIVAGWNFLLTIAAGEYVEFYWMSDTTQVTLQAYPAGSPPPSTASLIVTVTQQSGIMAGTGITAINSLTGAAQTLTTGTTGTDFAISSTGVTHTFNLPIASSVNTGKLSATDWSTFNGKANVDSQTFTGTPTLPTGTIATTQTAGDNSTKLATTAFVNNRVTGNIIVTSGTSFTTPATISASTVFIIELVGAGGGGGSVSSGTTGSGTGGGGGGYAYVKVTGLTASTTYACIIGAGGAGGLTTANGTAGTSTTLTIGATTYTASGGSGGSATSGTGVGGAGGAGTNGNINITGQAGMDSPTTASATALSSIGGNSPKGWGLGGTGVVAGKIGNIGTGYGGGGASVKSSTLAGGAGTNGIIYCTYYN